MLLTGMSYDAKPNARTKRINVQCSLTALNVNVLKHLLIYNPFQQGVSHGVIKHVSIGCL